MFKICTTPGSRKSRVSNSEGRNADKETITLENVDSEIKCERVALLEECDVYTRACLKKIT